MTWDIWDSRKKISNDHVAPQVGQRYQTMIEICIMSGLEINISLSGVFEDTKFISFKQFDLIFVYLKFEGTPVYTGFRYFRVTSIENCKGGRNFTKWIAGASLPEIWWGAEYCFPIFSAGGTQVGNRDTRLSQFQQIQSKLLT